MTKNKDDQKQKRPKTKMTKMEDDKMEDDINGRRPINQDGQKRLVNIWTNYLR